METRTPWHTPSIGIFVLTLILSTGSAAAQLNPAPVGTTDFGLLNQPPRAVAVSGDHACTADLYGLTIYDLSDPATPEKTGELLLPFPAQDVAISGSTAFVADNRGGLAIIDIGDPANPALSSWFQDTTWATGVTVSGTTAYVADSGGGLRIIDVSDPAEPLLLGTSDAPRNAVDVAISGTLAYVADSSAGLLIVDVSNPSNPVLLGSVTVDDGPYAVAVSDTTAYLAGGNEGLVTVNVADPTTPTVLATLDTDYRTIGVAVSDATAYLGDSGALSVIDVSDPAHPVALGSCSDSEFLSGLVVTGSTVWGADFFTGLERFDVSDPADPTLETTVVSAGEALAITASDSLLYVADSSAGLQIVDVRNPENPALLGGVTLTGWTRSVAVSGAVAHMGSYWGTLELVDISDPSEPSILGRFETRGEVFGIAVAGTVDYLACGSEGIQIVDVANPKAPRLLERLELQDWIQSVVVSKGTLFVGGSSGLNVLDVTDPADPRSLGTVPDMSVSERGLALSGHLLLIGDNSTATLKIFDVSDPGHPTLLGTVQADGWISDVVSVGSVAMLATGWTGWQAVDISDPANPVLLASYDQAPRDPSGIAVDRDTGTFWLAEGPVMEGFDLGTDACPALTIDVSPAAVPAGGAHAELTVRVTDGSGNPVTGVGLTASPESGRLSDFTDNGNGAFTATYTSGERIGWMDIPVSVEGTVCGGMGTVHVTFAAEPHLDDELPGNFRMIPGSAHVDGAHGTSWRSDAVLHNPGTRAASAALFFLENETDNSEATGRTVTVPAGASVALDDFVLGTFGRDNASGAVFVSSDEPLFVTSRTYNDAPSGTYGQLVPGISPSDAVRGDEVVRLIQLSRNSDFHTNIGFANAGDSLLHVTVELHRADGTVLGTPDYTIPPMGFFQKTDIIGTKADDAYAVISSDTPDAEYFTYASVVDNASGDPIFVLPVPATSQPLMIPAAAAVHGLAGTNWRTDLELHNAGDSTSTIHVYPLLRGQANPDPDGTMFELDPGESLRLDDVLGEEFGISGAAALRIVSHFNSDTMVTSRTYNDAGGGTYGQFIPAQPLDAATGAVRGGRLIQLSQSATDNSGFRTNIGLTNAADTPIDVVIALYDGAGRYLGDVPRHLEAFEYIQIDRIFRTVTGDAVSNGYAVVSSSTPGAAFYAFASVVDNRSGDSIYIPAVW